MPLNLAVLISGSGSNLQCIIDRVASGALHADIRLVVSNRSEAFGLERARKAGIPTVVLPHGNYLDREDFDRALIAAIRDHGADAVAMAGFMRMVTPMFLQTFPGRVLNIHPALLPSFPGTHGQRDAAEYGVRIAGCSVHFVDEGMDSGPIIIQAAVPAFPTDNGETLGARILTMEHRIYPQALQWLSEGRLSVQGRKVFVAPAARSKAFIGEPGEYMVFPPLEEGF
ncbi:MAG: phosphoribosylglycinamide formyltransferase [Desulfocurvibacter africanus]